MYKNIQSHPFHLVAWARPFTASIALFTTGLVNASFLTTNIRGYATVPDSYTKPLLPETLAAISLIVYINAQTEESLILSENKGKTGIYLWFHLESGKIYIGSAVDLAKRLSRYYSKGHLQRNKTMRICNALLLHTHSAFSLYILEILDITNLDKEEARLLILKLEQFYIDLFKPEFNILPTAGSSLGYTHTDEAKAKLSEANLGKTLTAETKAKISEAFRGKTLSAETKALISKTKLGENNPMYGKTHSEGTIALMSAAHTGKIPTAESKALMSEAKKGINNPNFGKPVSTETKVKISATLGCAIYVYNLEGSLVNTFTSGRKAAEFFNSHHQTIMKYLRNNKLFQDKWYLALSKDFKVNSNK